MAPKPATPKKKESKKKKDLANAADPEAEADEEEVAAMAAQLMKEVCGANTILGLLIAVNP